MDSLDNENILYPLNHTTWILLSSLWQKANNKKDFLDYFQVLSETLPNKNLFKKKDFLTDETKKEIFLKEEYNKEDYKTFYNQTLSLDKFEKLCFLYLGFKTYKNPLPPNLGMKSGVKYKDNYFPDCGETSLLNFFNAILYNPSKQEFDISILEELASENLKTFYTKHGTVKKMANTLYLHNDWAEVVSNLQGVTYNNANVCDIKAGLKNKGINNIFKVIENLLPGLPQEEESSILEQLEKVLNIEMKIEMPDKNDSPQIINFDIGININKLNWIFYSGHFVLGFPEKIIELEKYNDIIKNKLDEKDISSYDYIKYFTLARAYGMAPEITENKRKIFLYSLFLQKFDLENILEAMIKIGNEILDKSLKKQILLNFYSLIPDDRFSQLNALELLKPFVDFDDYKNKLPEVEKGLFIISFFRDKNIQLLQKQSNWIKKNLFNIKDKQHISLIIESILGLDPQKFNTDFLQFLYNWMEQSLPNYKNKFHIPLIIRDILKLDPPKINESFLQFLYNWIEQSLPNMENEQKQNKFKKQLEQRKKEIEEKD